MKINGLDATYCGSAWIGNTEVDYYAGYAGKSEDNLPLFAVFEKYLGNIHQYSDTTYPTLAKAEYMAWEIVASRNYD